MERVNRGCLGTKQKYDNKCNGERKQKRNSWQNDMLEKWVIQWAFKHVVWERSSVSKIKMFFL